MILATSGANGIGEILVPYLDKAFSSGHLALILPYAHGRVKVDLQMHLLEFCSQPVDETMNRLVAKQRAVVTQHV